MGDGYGEEEASLGVRAQAGSVSLGESVWLGELGELEGNMTVRVIIGAVREKFAVIGLWFTAADVIKTVENSKLCSFSVYLSNGISI